MLNKYEMTDFYEYITLLLLLLKLALLGNVVFIVRNIISKSFLFFYVFGFVYKILCVYKFMFIRADWQRSREVAYRLTKFPTCSPFK